MNKTRTEFTIKQWFGKVLLHKETYQDVDDIRVYWSSQQMILNSEEELYELYERIGDYLT